jgi:DNA-directed RNA polymerase subunit RPC12/RpoP
MKNKLKIEDGFLYSHLCIRCGRKTYLYKGKGEQACNQCGNKGNDFIFLSKEKLTVRKLQKEMEELNISLTNIIKKDSIEKNFNEEYTEKRNLKEPVLRKKMNKLLSLKKPPQKKISKLIKECDKLNDT